MLLATTEISNSTRIGAASEGLLTDQLTRVFPNGWGFLLSNDAYMTFDGTNYEQSSIPENVPIAYSRDEGSFYKKLQQQLITGDTAIKRVLKQ